ncbi:MAG TPA: ABC transporter permease [Gemmatimonadaceae bacterium]
MTLFTQDLRDALRSLKRSPGVTLMIVLTLGLGLGGATAIFSVVNGVLLRPLPYPEPHAVVRIWNHFEGTPQAPLSPAEYFDYRDRVHAFAAFGGYATGEQMTLTGGEEPERVSAAYLTTGVFPALGVPPALGRAFTPDEDWPGAEKVVVLSHRLWVDRFGGSPSVIGTRITLDGEARTVIGVMPTDFRLPEDFAGEPTQVLVPLAYDRTTVPNRGSHFLRAVARLAPGVTLERAQQEVRTVAAQFVRDYPDAYPAGMHFSASVLSLHQDVLGAVRPALLVLLGAVGLLLLIACANVAGLLLSRADARRREFAVRAALGAGRMRLVRQLLAESLALAILGGALGVLIAYWGTHALVAAQPGDIPRMSGVGLDVRVLGFAFALSLATGLAFGLVPALRAGRSDVQASLREGGRGPTAGAGRQRGQRLLVVAETALTLMLLIGAGLLARSFVNLRNVNPGFRSEHVLTARVTLPDANYPTPAAVTRFYRRLVDRLGELPAVNAAGAVSFLPLATTLGDLNVHIEGRSVPEGDVSPRGYWLVVTPGYFRALGMRMLEGRAIQATDDERAPGAVVINETMARRYWPGEDAIGKRFTLGGGAGPGVVTVVGVVDDVRHGSLDAAPKPQMYLAHAQFRMWNTHAAVTGMTLVLRTPGNPAQLTAEVRQAVHALDPNLPVSDVRTMARVVSSSIARPRFMTMLLSLFAGVALMLAAVGLYAVMAYAVSRRTHEIGIRMALGAREGEVARMVVSQGLVLALAGIAIGLMGGVALHRLIASQLFDVSATDPMTLAAVSALVAVIACVACYVPARRAARVDPVIALREE